MGLGKTYSTKYLVDSNNNTGAVGEVLVSTATGINWANGSDIVGGPYLPLAGGVLTGNVRLNDDVEIRLGTSSDFKAAHNGSYTYMRNYTGDLFIEALGTNNDLYLRGADNVYIRPQGNENGVVVVGNAEVSLYYDNVVKFETTSTGATVSGALAVDGKITNLTAGTGNLDAVNVQQLNDATTGALIFKGTWSAASTTTSTTSAAVSNSTIVVISSSNTGISVGATVTGAALPVGITVTAIAVDEITLTISSAQSITSGATLTFTTVGGIPDLSQTARKVTGDYYICETAGVATPNGTGTTPDDWAVGDWVAFSDLATDAWQKIDNSSVLSGAGTGGTVPVWAGSGTSVTLADAPITVSGSDTTFGGFISTSSYIYAGGAVRVPYAIASKMPMIVLSGGATNFGLFHTEATTDIFSFDFAGVSKQSFYQNGNATFAGAVTAPTFSGDLNGTINTATTGATQTAGDNSTLIATTAYADAAAAAGGGNFLPLAGGTMTGTSGVIFPDNFNLKIGTGSDLKIFHNATDSFIINEVGDLKITNGANDKDIIFQSDDGSGGVTTYFYLDGGRSDGTNFATRFPDQSIILLGSGTGWNDGAQIYHSGTGTFINNYVGNLTFTEHANDGDIIFNCDDGSGGVANYLTLDGSTTHVYFSNPGNVGIGTTNPGESLEILKDGGAIIKLHDPGNNSWKIKADSDFHIYDDTNSDYLTILNSGNVGIGTTSPSEKLEVDGNVLVTAALLSNQENIEVDTGAETVASVLIATYIAAFFDFVIKEGTNLRAGTVFACHDGTNVVYTETSTNDLGDTSDVTLSVDILGTDMRLRATVTSDDWIIKSLIRAI